MSHFYTYFAEKPFCIVGKTHVISNQFTTEYESVVLKCKALIGLNEEERIHALHLLIDKYSPDDKVIGAKYAEKSFHRTEIIRLDIEEASEKCKRGIPGLIFNKRYKIRKADTNKREDGRAIKGESENRKPFLYQHSR